MVRAAYPQPEWLTNILGSLIILTVRDSMKLNWFESSGGTGAVRR